MKKTSHRCSEADFPFFLRRDAFPFISIFNNLFRFRCLCLCCRIIFTKHRPSHFLFNAYRLRLPQRSIPPRKTTAGLASDSSSRQGPDATSASTNNLTRLAHRREGQDPSKERRIVCNHFFLRRETLKVQTRPSEKTTAERTGRTAARPRHETLDYKKMQTTYVILVVFLVLFFTALTAWYLWTRVLAHGLSAYTIPVREERSGRRAASH